MLCVLQRCSAFYVTFCLNTLTAPVFDILHEINEIPRGSLVKRRHFSCYMAIFGIAWIPFYIYRSIWRGSFT